MRTLRYILTGRPGSVCDCLDFSRQEPPVQVRLELLQCQAASDVELFEELLGRFTWEYAEQNVYFDELYASVPGWTDSEHRRRIFARANRQLACEIRRIRQAGYPLHVAPSRFSPEWTNLTQEKRHV